MIKSIFIENYRTFESFNMDLGSEMNIIVGDNEQGKSTILEAINIALTKRLNGKLIEYELSPYLFNKKTVKKYLDDLVAGNNPDLPRIIVELYFEEEDSVQYLRGTNNSKKEDSCGIRFEIAFDEDYKEDYSKLITDISQIKSIPSEFYKISWLGFSGNGITTRLLPFSPSFIDATTIKLQSGTDYYLQSIISNGLDVKERVGLSVAYRNLKEQFAEEEAIKAINTKLEGEESIVSDRKLSIALDISQKSSWETNLVPNLADIPFQMIGKGEQNALKIMLALNRKADKSNIILIEEPENHLSYSSMNILIDRVNEKCKGKQILITTHSAYVLNKLGIGSVILLQGAKTSKMEDLPKDTQEYFKKLSGYDTLRLILAKKAILVEGPSDELIVQKAYLQKHGKLPIQEGVDVINVRGLSFARFLDIAQNLTATVNVVTDNDSDYENKVMKKYEAYTVSANIKVFSSDDNSLNTLEPNLVKSAGRELLNKILSKSFSTEAELISYMVDNKTECALRIFDSREEITFPKYIEDAIV